MGLLSGSGSWLLFRFRGQLPEDWREVFQEGINKHAHVERLEFRTKDPNIGWVCVDEPTEAPKHGLDWLHNGMPVLGVRTDKKSINGKMLEALLVREMEKIRAERAVAAISKKWRKEIKEALAEELLAKQTPSLNMGEFVIDLEHSHEFPDEGIVEYDVYAFGTSIPTPTMIRETFGVDMYVDRYVDWLFDAGMDEGAICEGMTRVFGAGHQKDLFEQKQQWPNLLKGHEAELGQDFLTWLWYETDRQQGTMHLSVEGMWDIWLEGKVALNDDKNRISIGGESIADMAEAIDALYSGRRPTEIQLGAKKGELEWTFSITHRMHSTVIKGAKLQKVVGDVELVDKLWDRFNQTLKLQVLVRALFVEFFKFRVSGKFDDAIQMWIETRRQKLRSQQLEQRIEATGRQIELLFSTQRHDSYQETEPKERSPLDEAIEQAKQADDDEADDDEADE